MNKIIICVICSILLFCGCQNNKTSSSSKATPSMPVIKTLDLKGDSSIIVTIFPSVMEENSYLIELFDNGMIETSVGKANKKAFFGEFTGTKKDIFREIIEKRQRALTRSEIELINEMMSCLDLTKISKQHLKKQVAQDANQKIIWMGNKAYYFCGTLPSYNEVTELIEQITECSPIKIEIK